MNNIFFNQNSDPALELEDLNITLMGGQTRVTASSLNPVKSDLEIVVYLRGTAIGSTSEYSATCTINMSSGSTNAYGTPNFNTGVPVPVLKVTILNAVVYPKKDRYYNYTVSFFQ